MKKDVIQYRRERAKETLTEASILIANNKFFAAVNRIYYAVFYEVSALLLIEDIVSSKHSGVRGYFNKHFIKTGLIPQEYGDFYNKIFEFRQKSDYEDFVEFEAEMVKEWYRKGESFMVAIDQKIDELLASIIT